MADDVSNLAKKLMDKFGGGKVDFEQVLKLFSTDAGKKVLATLLSDGGNNLKQAAEKAKNGDISGVGEIVSAISSTNEGREILRSITDENLK
ncbi:MAG: hypothetical protein IKU65_04510 [Oscillospiraceae bacterium]|nr:hypothetical protein [Oscillospiraceae bacterium]